MLAVITGLLTALGLAVARVLEVGRGALAAALADLGYEVTGVDRNADMTAAAGERGVPVIQADVHDVSGEYDVVLFTRSLHHAEDLDGILAHAGTLLAPSGRLIGHDFLHQGSAMLAALSRVGSDLTTVATAMLWRLVDGRGGAWTEPATRAPDAIRQAEERRIAAGTLPSVGLLASIRR